jgi:hypothetical protein
MVGREIFLNAGDSEYLNPTHPLGFAPVGNEPAGSSP